MQSEHIFSEWGGCLYSWQWPGIQRVQLDKKASPPQHANISPQRASMLGRGSKNLNFFSTHNPNALDVIAMAIMKLGLCPPTEGAVVGSEVEASWLLSDKAGPRCLGGKGAVWEICRDQGNTQCWACFSPLLCWRHMILANWWGKCWRLLTYGQRLFKCAKAVFIIKGLLSKTFLKWFM